MSIPALTISDFKRRHGQVMVYAGSEEVMFVCSSNQWYAYKHVHNQQGVGHKYYVRSPPFDAQANHPLATIYDTQFDSYVEAKQAVNNIVGAPAHFKHSGLIYVHQQTIGSLGYDLHAILARIESGKWKYQYSLREGHATLAMQRTHPPYPTRTEALRSLNLALASLLN